MNNKTSYIVGSVLILLLVLISAVAINSILNNSRNPKVTTYDIQQYFVDLNGDGLQDLIVEGKVIINTNPIVADSFPKSQ